MATLDIRNTDEEITEIKFSGEEYIYKCNHLAIGIFQNLEPDHENKMYIYKKDIPNLIKALNKAKELGWY